MFGRKKLTSESEGEYRIVTYLDSWNDWCAKIHKGNSRFTEHGITGVGGYSEKARQRVINEAKAWIDNKIEAERVREKYAGQQDEIWYGQSPQAMQKTITTMAARIDELERDLQVGDYAP